MSAKRTKTLTIHRQTVACVTQKPKTSLPLIPARFVADLCNSLINLTSLKVGPGAGCVERDQEMNVIGSHVGCIVVGI